MNRSSRILAATAGALAAGAAWAYLRERRTEQPEHAVLAREGAFELRRYPRLLAAETVRAGEGETALRDGYGILSDYIFAESREGEAIEMTAPVMALAASEGRWRIRFVMPAMWTREALPDPGEGVSIVEIPGRRIAAVHFRGRATDTLLARKEAALRAWIAELGLQAADSVEYAFYGSPSSPRPLRRSEILIEVT